MREHRFISVYRSGSNTDTYVYVRRGQRWDELPETLRNVFGKPLHSMDLLLTPEKRLARTTGAQVLEAIDEQDFYLQMPEKLESYLVEFKQTLRQRQG